MKQLFTTLSALALLSFGATAQDTPAVQPEPAPAPAVDVTPAPEPAPAPAVDAAPAPEPAPAPAADAAPAPEPAPAPAADAATASEAAPAPAAEAATAAAGESPSANIEKVDPLPLWEMLVFCIVVAGVIGLGIWKSGAGDKKKEEGASKEGGVADYFLAGRGLSWWLVGFSLLAANISTEQFVGMSGQASDWLGIAIAGYEWLAAIVLVIVAFSFLPMLLKRGVFTIPQFLEERFNGVARVTMAIANLLILVGVPTAAVIYAGSTVVSVYFDLPVTTGCIIIAVCATVYVYIGGLKACAWTDLIWGSGLLLGGAVVAYFALNALGNVDPATAHDVIDSASISATNMVNGDVAGAMQSTGNALADGAARLWTLNDGDATSSINGIAGKMHMMRPEDDPTMPWTVYLLGLWIPNFFYWGLNQYIMQRTLASKSLEEGQLGVVFAAFLKLLVPFVVIVPGILAYNLFRGDLKSIADNRADQVVKAAADEKAKSGREPIYTITVERLVRAEVADQCVEQPQGHSSFRDGRAQRGCQSPGCHRCEDHRERSQQHRRLQRHLEDGRLPLRLRLRHPAAPPAAGHRLGLVRAGCPLRCRRELAGLDVQLGLDALHDGHLRQGQGADGQARLLRPARFRGSLGRARPRPHRHRHCSLSG